MNDSDKIKITITIAGERIPLTVPGDKRGIVRQTEREVSDLFTEWRRNYPQKTDMEILAMVAYQYASFYRDLKNRYEDARDLALGINDRLMQELGIDESLPEK